MVVIQADLTAARTDAIVNAANEQLWHGGGVTAALAAVAGGEFMADSYRWVSEHGPDRSGQAAVTSGGGLPARWGIAIERERTMRPGFGRR